MLSINNFIIACQIACALTITRTIYLFGDRPSSAFFVFLDNISVNIWVFTIHLFQIGISDAYTRTTVYFKLLTKASNRSMKNKKSKLFEIPKYIDIVKNYLCDSRK